MGRNRWNLRGAGLVILAFMLLASFANADSGLGRHKKMYVVPKPGPVVIDGKLDDWDLSGQITMYVASETSDMMGARCAMMYDDEALYVSGVVRDSSPMMNRHDPNVDPEMAWDADVCQIFMSLDPALPYPLNFSSFDKDKSETDKACTLLMWHYTDRAEANLVALKAMTFNKALRPDLNEKGVIPHDKFQGVYLKSEDGRGYTFEYRIPWSTLGVKPVKADQILAASICIFWGRADGLKTGGGNSWCYDVMAGPGFVFQSSAVWGKLMFTPAGKISKDLVEAGLPPEKPLPLKFEYELAKDREITIQLEDADKNIVRLLVAQGERRAGKNFELWDGMDGKGNPMPAGKYTWKGVQHDPIKYKAIFSVHNSGIPPWPTDDNKGGWGGDHGTPSDVCAVPDGLVLAWNCCEYGWGIIRVDLQGKKQWGSKRTAEHIASDGKRIFVAGGTGFETGEGIFLLDLKDSRPIPFGNNKPSLLPPPGGDKKTDAVTGLAYHNGRVFVAFGARNLIAVYDADKGEMLTTWNVQSPGRIAVRNDGSFSVISGSQVLNVSADGKSSPFIAAELDTPTGIAVASDGTTYVANAGKRQSVSVFDAKGKFIRNIGKDGGRPAIGKYDREGIYMPGGMALDQTNRLWVAETTDSPKRFSIWDVATGKNLQEYFGSSGYFGYGYFDPAKPNEMLAHNVLWEIDWKTLKGTPTTTVWRKTSPDMIEGLNPEGYGGVARIITAKDGRQYMWGGGGFKSIISRRDGDLFKPFAATIFIYDSPLYGGQNSPLLDDKKKFPNGNYFWQDANDDQCVQAEEVKLFSQGYDRPQFSVVDPDLNIWLANGSVMRPQGKTGTGCPAYDVAKIEKTPMTGKTGEYFWLDPDGSFYTLRGPKTGLVKFSSSGEILWNYPDIIGWHYALSLPLTGPGQLHGMTGPMGVSGNFTANMTYFGVNHIFTRDGVYVAAIMKDGRNVLTQNGDDVGQPEGQGGEFVMMRPEPNGPERFFAVHGGQDSRVWEIYGLNTVEPLAGGVLEITKADAELAAAKNMEYKTLLSKSRRLSLARGRSALDTAEPVSKAIDSNRRFETRASYDENNLYVSYDVVSSNQLINCEPEPTLVFRGGNCLDLQIATDPGADLKRKTPAIGDIRVLITRKADSSNDPAKAKTFAVLYQPLVPGFKGERTMLKSPTGSESFDSIKVIEDFKLEYQKTADGFRAVVTLPLSVLNWKPLPGKAVKMDVGYIFGNESGSRSSARAYWNNNSFSANVTNDIPNESRMEPAEWGDAMVE